jgi:predicted DNA-binding transcriptional regulator AlpA
MSFLIAFEMSVSNDNSLYLDIEDLVALSGLSRATIWRLKRAGKIPYFQPSGKNGRVLFPPDAIERMGESAESQSPTNSPSEEKLPGPSPSWMTSTQRTKQLPKQ